MNEKRGMGHTFAPTSDEKNSVTDGLAAVKSTENYLKMPFSIALSLAWLANDHDPGERHRPHSQSESAGLEETGQSEWVDINSRPGPIAQTQHALDCEDRHGGLIRLTRADETAPILAQDCLLNLSEEVGQEPHGGNGHGLMERDHDVSEIKKREIL